MNAFSRSNCNLQILITDRSIEVLSELRGILPDMQRLTSSKLTNEQSAMMLTYMDKLIG